MSTGLPVFTLFHVGVECSRDHRWLGRGVRADFRETVENLDQHISADYRSDQRDRILVSVHKFLPSHGVGIASLLVLGMTIPAVYVFHLAGAWRRVYVIGAVSALYLNVFVLIAQFFMKIPALKVLAPTQSEPPFLGTQIVVMLIFVVLRVLASKRFPGEPVPAP